MHIRCNVCSLVGFMNIRYVIFPHCAWVVLMVTGGGHRVLV
jgi:hypothetical protein